MVQASILKQEYTRNTGVTKQQELEESKMEISWGGQIRSYVLDMSRVKDLRTNIEHTQPQDVLDGDLDKFIEASLLSGL